MKYNLSITHAIASELDDNPVTVVTTAFGSAAVVSYAFNDVREELAGAGGEKFEAVLTSDDGKEIVNLTAGGATLAKFLKSELAAVRKAEKPASE